MKKRIVSLLLALLVLMSMVPVVSAAGVKPTSVSILETLTMDAGTSQRFTANMSPQNADRAYLWWTAGNPGVATVSQDGVITAKRAGQCHITATAPNGAKSTCLVTVRSTDVTSVSILKTLTMDVGTSQKFTVTVQPSNAANKNITWSAGNPGVATIDQNGVITAKKAGQCHIIATAHNGVKAVCLVTVIGKVTMYALDGRTAQIPDNKVQAHQKVGWYLLNDYINAILTKTESLVTSSGYWTAVKYIDEQLGKAPLASTQADAFYKKAQNLFERWQKALGTPLAILGSSVQYDSEGRLVVSIQFQNLQPHEVTYLETQWNCVDANGKVIRTINGIGSVPDLDPYDTNTIYWDISEYPQTVKLGNLQLVSVSYDTGYTWNK